MCSIWRPFNGPVLEWPLAICDGSSVDPNKLIETDHVRRQYAGCTLYALSDPKMRFYYMQNQEDNEVLLFKNFDSDPTVVTSMYTYISDTSYLFKLQRQFEEAANKSLAE